MEKKDDVTLFGSGKDFHVSLAVLTNQTKTIDKWFNQLISLSEDSRENAWELHLQKWSEFWGRSWVEVSGNDDLFLLSQMTILQRFSDACKPIPFLLFFTSSRYRKGFK